MILGLRDVEPLWDQISPSELRAVYEGATLSQRYSVAKQRINDPGGEPNRVVTAVAALEGFARAVAVDYRTKVGELADAAYSELRHETLINLLWNHIVPQLDGGGARLGDRKDWAMLGRAVRFRNLLVHEATFLHGGTARELRNCAEGFLNRLAEAVGVTTRARVTPSSVGGYRSDLLPWQSLGAVRHKWVRPVCGLNPTTLSAGAFESPMDSPWATVRGGLLAHAGALHSSARQRLRRNRAG